MAEFSGQNIECVRGERTVLNGVGFSVSGGCALMLRGPNGVGKSTMLRLMAGLMRPRAGAITWDGRDIAEDPSEHNARFTYVGHADAVKSAMSVYENVAFWADLAGEKGQAPKDALAALGIAHLADLPARYLSAGQRRRVTLCRMLTSGARLWLLDEPTTALDTAASGVLTELIREHLASDGMAVISTHGDLALSSTETLTLGQST